MSYLEINFKCVNFSSLNVFTCSICLGFCGSGNSSGFYTLVKPDHSSLQKETEKNSMFTIVKQHLEIMVYLTPFLGERSSVIISRIY